MKKILTIYVIFIVSITILFAQPTEFDFTPNDMSGSILATVQVDGMPASDSDFIAAFDEDDNCAGAFQILNYGGNALSFLQVYGDILSTTDVDEGINEGETFTFKLWVAATNQILEYPTPVSGWHPDLNGSPIPGYSFADVIVLNFTTNNSCHIDDWTALKALYESTNGDFWTNRTGWGAVLGDSPPANCNLRNLYGVTVNVNGRVTCIDFADGFVIGYCDSDSESNNLSGSIPLEIYKITNLVALAIDGSQLSGSIPSELGNLSNLTYLYLSNNELSGSIPPELGNLSNLKYLNLSNNQVIGSIPSELGILSNLQNLRLNSNQLSGSIPPELGNLNKLTMLTINDNDLSGCYNENLAILCTQLTSSNFDGNADISDSNNFEATWEDFCASEAGICINDDNCEEDCETSVYPGDLNHDGIVNNQDVSLSGLFQYQSGIARAPQHQSIVWDAYPAQDWGIVNNQNKDIKHHDCNGDGTIDEDDQQAVEDNLGLTWDTPPPPNPPDESDYQVMLQPTDQIYDGNLVMNVSLERRAGGNLTLQGGHFTVDYSDLEANFSNVALNFVPISWLGTPTINLWYESTHLESDKKIEVGFTKTNNVDSEGSGIIGQLILEYDNGLARQAGASNISYNFEVKAIGVHQNNGDFIPIEDQQLEIIIDSDICYSNLIIDEEAPFQNLYKSSNTITTNDFVIIGANQKVEFNANRVRINAGFSAKAGADFKVRNVGCN